MKKLLTILLVLTFGIVQAQQPNNTNTKFVNGLAAPNGATNVPTSGLTAGAIFYKTGVGFQYYDGTSWQTIGISGAGVTSFNTRTGAVTLTSGDVTTALGFTPVTNARTLTINGSAQDLSTNRTWTITTTGTSNKIDVSGGTGLTPTITISPTYVGQTSITTLGTVATGVWNGTAIANANLANSSLTIGSTNIALGATSTTLAGLSSVTSTTFIGALTGNASTATSLAGGLGGQIPYQSAVNTTAFLANGSAGQVLQSNGTTTSPSWVTPSSIKTTITKAGSDINAAGYIDLSASSIPTFPTLQVYIDGVQSPGIMFWNPTNSRLYGFSGSESSGVVVKITFI